MAMNGRSSRRFASKSYTPGDFGIGLSLSLSTDVGSIQHGISKAFRMFVTGVVLFQVIFGRSVSQFADAASNSQGIPVASSSSADTIHRVTGCPAEFRQRCHCGSVPYPQAIGPKTYVTNCTDSGFDDASMLAEMPIETEVLVFTGNEVKDLPLRNIFGNITYKNLHTIDLSNNRIQTIKGRTFHHVQNVKKLILNDNDLYITGKDFHERMFSNFVELRELHLRHTFTRKLRSDQYLPFLDDIFNGSSLNQLTILNLEDNDISVVSEPNIFCPLFSLKELYLSENFLSGIPFNISCLPKLELLDLSENSISHLDNASLTRLEAHNPGAFKLNLSGNPFRCDCNMTDMAIWLRRTRIEVIDKESYRCYAGFPVKNIGMALVNVSIEDLQCPIILDEFDAHLTASYVVLGLIIVIFTVVLSVILYMNRKSVMELAYKCAEPVRTKRQYTSLDTKRDEAEMEV